MLLSEMVRNLKNETNLYSDAAKRIWNQLPSDWTDRLTVNFSLSAESFVIIKFAPVLGSNSTAITMDGNVRALLDDVIVAALGWKRCSLSGAGEMVFSRKAIVRLAAGSHTLKLQTSVVYLYPTGSTAAYIGFQDVNVGVISFSDFATIADTGDSGSISAEASATTTVKSVSVTASPSRKTAVGTVKQVPILIFASVVCEGAAISKLKNPGETDDALLNWKLFVDGVQKAWTDRNDDYQTTNSAYAEGAWGYHGFAGSPGNTYTIDLKVYNGAAAAKTVRARLLAVACPWFLLSEDHEPLALSFPQGSTLYITTEPLFDNQTKNVKIGKKRAVSFGDADYYYINSGADILHSSFTFETVEVEKCVLNVNGFGGCISIIGVDVR